MKKLLLLSLLILLLFVGCSSNIRMISLSSDKPLRVKSLTFQEIPNWEESNFTMAFESFKRGCRLRRIPQKFQESCHHIDDPSSPKSFFETYFQPLLWLGEDEKDTGLVTGYYEPLLQGRSHKSKDFSVPLLKTPADLLHISLGDLYPELKGRVLRGRLVGNKVIPYYTRQEIGENIRDDDVLCWVKDKVDLFFLQVQGSGRIQLDENETLYVGYGDKNGHPYNSIGNYMIKKGYMQYHEMSLQGIKAWAQEHPKLIDEVLNHNDSYLFFNQNKTPAKGAMGVVLTPQHSLAVDTNYIPLGLPVFLTTKHPLDHLPFSRLAVAQDRGAAIKGKKRVDFFWGFGEEAALCAGRTKSQGELILLVPKSQLKEP